MANKFLDDLIEHMLADPQGRQALNLAYPRRIVPPAGYMNPRYYAPTTASACVYAMNSECANDFVKSCIFFIARKLVSLRVPTFFVGQEFAEAVSETRIESEMRSSEINWPDDAMLFVLPEKFSREFFGYHIPFLAMANYSDDEIRKMPGIRVMKPDGSPSDSGAKGKLDGQVFMDFQWHLNNTEPGVDYVSAWPAHTTLANVASALMEHTMLVTSEEKEALASGIIDKVGMEDESIERKLTCKMRDFSATLLMAMTAEPMFVERGVLQRKAKVKHGVLRSELWSPNTIGFKYRHPHRDPMGTHASPRFHRRNGHLRDQHYGPANSKVRRQWIKPMWVGANVK